MKARIGLLLLALWSAGGLWARDLGELYDRQTLSQAAAVYGPNIQGLFREDFLDRLTFQERVSLPNVHLETPLIGPQRSPWEFFALPARQKIVVPVLSIRFLDDLAITYAHLERHQCDREQLFNYLTRLFYDKRFPAIPPRQALGIPADALDDPYVDDVSQKILKSTIYFLIGHEYAHLLYQHQGYERITAAQAQAQESQSDTFALEIMRRVGVPPLSMAFFFTLASRIDPVPAAFSSTAEFERYLQKKQTHPLTGKRLQNVADYLRRHADSYARLQANPTTWVSALQASATDIENLGRIVHDARFRQFQLKRGLAATESQMRSACR